MIDLSLVRHSLIEQGPGYSPDGGNLWRAGNLIYWEDGEVVDLEQRDSYIIRYMRLTHGVDYSKWTDEQREAAKNKKAETIAKYKVHAAELISKRDKFVESAKTKLTTEEFEAVLSLGGDEY